MNPFIWLALFIVLVVFEITTLGLTTIWFAVGALVALVASMLHAVWWLQFLLFIIVSFVTLIFTRPLAVKYLNKDTVKTNVDEMAGMVGKVVKKIDNLAGEGYVVIKGQEWAARSADDLVIEEGTLVEVMSVQGVKVIVKVKSVEEEN